MPRNKKNGTKKFKTARNFVEDIASDSDDQSIRSESRSRSMSPDSGDRNFIAPSDESEDADDVAISEAPTQPTFVRASDLLCASELADLRRSAPKAPLKPAPAKARTPGGALEAKRKRGRPANPVALPEELADHPVHGTECSKNGKKRRPKSAKLWCVTLFDCNTIFACDQLEDALNEAKITYGYQHEISPTTGKKHLQMWLYKDDKNFGFEAIRHLLSKHGKPHIFYAKGTLGENIAYCSKVESRDPLFKNKYATNFVEGSIPLDVSNGSGKRTDIIQAVSYVDSNVISVQQLLRVTDEKNLNCLVRHHQYFAARVRARPPAKQVIDELYEWQAVLLSYLTKEKPHSRAIIWVHSTEGNYGKSYLAKLLETNFEALTVGNCKSADVAAAYFGQPIVSFDFTKTTDWDMVNWSTMESIKNGHIFSPKYEVVSKVYKQPHVVVFANKSPDRSKLSADRFYVIDLDIDPSLSVGIKIPPPATSRDVRLKKVKWDPNAGMSHGSGEIIPSDVIDLTKDARLDGIGLGNPPITADGNRMRFDDRPFLTRQNATMGPGLRKPPQVDQEDVTSSDDEVVVWDSKKDDYT